MAAYEHRLRVRFQHTDPAGIVFFANILVYCHEAYEEFLRNGGIPLEEFLKSDRCAEGASDRGPLGGGKRQQTLPLGHAEATFKRPFRAGQLVTVRVSVGRVGDRSFRLEYDLFGEEGEHLATAATVHVSVDPATGRSTGIAPELRALLERYASPA